MYTYMCIYLYECTVYLYVCSFPYIILEIHVCSSVDEQSRHLRLAKVSKAIYPKYIIYTCMPIGSSIQCCLRGWKHIEMDMKANLPYHSVTQIGIAKNPERNE